MFKLFRRLSSSVYQRPDRPWSEDATSNAPTIGRKRRMDDDDDDQNEAEASSTRKRRGQLQREDTATSDFGEVLPKGKEADPSVKEVTQGVKEVEIDEEKAKDMPKEDVQEGKGPETPAEASADVPKAVQDVPVAPAGVRSGPGEFPTAPIAISEPSNPAALPLPEADADEEDALAANPPSSPALGSADSAVDDSPSPEALPTEKSQDNAQASQADVTQAAQDTPSIEP